jgi:hypothetical protein
LPDLNPLDFYLWGHVKTIVYTSPVDNEEALHHRIVDACQTIRNYSSIFEWMQQSMMRRVEACTEHHGRHFEHLLEMYSLSHNSQIKYFWTYVGMDIFSCFGMCNSCPKFVCTFQLHPVYGVPL